MGTLDRGLRIIIAIVASIFYFGGAMTGILGTIVLVLSIIFLITGFVGFCPIYAPLGLSSVMKKGKKR